MSKIANYLGSHLRGEVLTTNSVRDSVSRDGSILRTIPLLVTYPFNTNDVRKVTHFAWQLAEKGHTLAVTARGSGSSNVGAAIGGGLVVSMSTHFNKILEVDTKQKLVRLQPGVSIKNLQMAMQTHGLTWPVHSHNSGATVGGAIANNLFGESGHKYGAAGDWIDQLEVVLASGESIQTKRLSKRELNKKMGLSGAEGAIYRELDTLISDNEDIIADLTRHPGNAGYALSKVKDKKGNFDLTPLIAGSQGSLGIITEAIVKLSHHSAQTEVMVACLGSSDELEQLVVALKKQNPSTIDYIDAATLGYAAQKMNVKIDNLLPENQEVSTCAGLVFVEINEAGRIKSKVKKIHKLFHKYGHETIRSNGNLDVADEMRQSYVRLLTLLTKNETDDHKITVPVIEDAIVPESDTTSFIASVHALGKKHRLQLLVWAHLGTGVMHVRPFLNIRNLTDKKKLDKLMTEYYQLVIKTDGSVAGEYGEGRLRAQAAAKQFSQQENELFSATKKIFDAHSIFNPGVKIAVQTDPFIGLNESFTH